MPVRKGRIWRCCGVCDKMFCPVGKRNQMCLKCRKLSREKRYLKA
jgi:hypothetical protein